MMGRRIVLDVNSCGYMTMAIGFATVTMKTGVTTWGSWVLTNCQREALNGAR